MVPKAQFIVHYIKDNEIISDRLEIDLGDDLQNFVSYSTQIYASISEINKIFNLNFFQVELDISTKETRPGKEVDITVISKPNSYVGLMGIDQSVLLLRKGNDLDKSQVFNELDEFSRKQLLPQRYYGIDEWEDFAVSKITTKI